MTVLNSLFQYCTLYLNNKQNKLKPTFDFYGEKNANLLFKNKLIII